MNPIIRKEAKRKFLRFQIARIHLRYYNCFGLTCEYIKNFLFLNIFVYKRGINKGKTYIKNYIIGEKNMCEKLNLKHDNGIRHYYCTLEFEKKIEIRQNLYEGRGIFCIEDCNAQVTILRSFSSFLSSTNFILISCQNYISSSNITTLKKETSKNNFLRDSKGKFKSQVS